MTACTNALASIPKGDTERRDLRRQLLSDACEKMLFLGHKATFPSNAVLPRMFAEYRSELEWGEADLWQGKALCFRAHELLLSGKPHEAREYLRRHAEGILLWSRFIRDDWDKWEPSDLSALDPKAEMHFILGAIESTTIQNAMAGGSKADAIKRDLTRNADGDSDDGFLRQMYSILLKNPTSPWSELARLELKRMQALFRLTFGEELKVTVTPKEGHRDRAAP
ncbi:MAG: hypothetical protein ACOYLM_11360 [Methylococcaceae bacterium]